MLRDDSWVIAEGAAEWQAYASLVAGELTGNVHATTSKLSCPRCFKDDIQQPQGWRAYLISFGVFLLIAVLIQKLRHADYYVIGFAYLFAGIALLWTFLSLFSVLLGKNLCRSCGCRWKHGSYEAQSHGPDSGEAWRPAYDVGQLPESHGIDGMAIASLVTGILALTTGPITGIPAVICGHIARSRIRMARGRLGGGGMALAGLILGYTTTGLALIILLAVLILFFWPH